MSKYAANRPYADPEKAARRLIEIASTIETIQEGRIYIERITGPSYSRTRLGRKSTRQASRWRWRAAGS